MSKQFWYRAPFEKEARFHDQPDPRAIYREIERQDRAEAEAMRSTVLAARMEQDKALGLVTYYNGKRLDELSDEELSEAEEELRAVRRARP
ncbi:hypothetical protein [Microvirga sp. G4-2]|uniref:hypothetical protein n=1 Tax=Microvirga sp. G4-2 TaxID=3434467 RepID=UPI0040448CC7